MGWKNLGDKGILIDSRRPVENPEALRALGLADQVKLLIPFLVGLRKVDLTGDPCEDPLKWLGMFQQAMSLDATDVIVVRSYCPKFAGFLDTFLKDHPEFARFVDFRTHEELQRIICEARGLHN